MENIIRGLEELEEYSGPFGLFQLSECSTWNGMSYWNNGDRFEGNSTVIQSNIQLADTISARTSSTNRRCPLIRE